MDADEVEEEEEEEELRSINNYSRLVNEQIFPCFESVGEIIQKDRSQT